MMAETNKENLENFFQQAFSSDEAQGDVSSLRHPTSALLVDYVYDQLASEDRSRVSAHIARCSLCLEEVNTLRQELESVEHSFASFIVKSSVRERLATQWPMQIWQMAQRTAERIKRWWDSPRLTGRRAFGAHALAYVTAGVVLMFVQLTRDSSLLQSSGTADEPTWVGWMVGAAAVLWGLWFVYLLVHGIRSWKKGKRKG